MGLGFKHRKAAKRKAETAAASAPVTSTGVQTDGAETQPEKRRPGTRRRTGEQLDVVTEVQRKEREEAEAAQRAAAEAGTAGPEGEAASKEAEESKAAEEAKARRRAGVEKRRATMAKKKAEKEAAAARKAAEEAASDKRVEGEETGAAEQEEEAARKKAAEEAEAKKRATVEKRRATMARKKAEKEAAASGPKTVKATPAPPPSVKTDGEGAEVETSSSNDSFTDYLSTPTRKAREVDLPEDGQTLSQATLVDLFHKKMSDPEFARRYNLVPIEKRSNSEAVLKVALQFIFDEVIPTHSCFVMTGVKIKQKVVDQRIHRIPSHKVTDPSITHVKINNRLIAEMRVMVNKGESIYGTLPQNVEEVEYDTDEERLEARNKMFIPAPVQDKRS